VSSATAARDVTETMVGFARTLRAAGVNAGPDRVQAMLRALDHLDVTSRADVYWAGRLSLCADPDDLARYDSAFAAYFAGELAPPGRRPPPAVEVTVPVALPGGPDGGGEPAEHGDPRAATASAAEVLRRRDLAQLTAPEREEVRRMLAALAVPAPTRPSRRYRPARRGPLDPRRTVRAMLDRGGEPAQLRRRARSDRARRLLVVVDVSGSMAPYADALLRFGHAAARRRHGTEVFTVGTRLTRVTRELRHRDADTALAAAAAAIPDWSGGTRLGDELKELLDRWGQRGVARGALAVVASDGWERGDPTRLGEQMARLHRLAHRVVWVNPHVARPGYQPLTAGMAAALPYVDDLVEGHSLAALQRLAGLVSAGGGVGAPGLRSRGAGAGGSGPRA